MVLVGLVTTVLPASGSSIEPTLVNGNPTCSDFGWDGPGRYEYKHEPTQDGTFNDISLAEDIELDLRIFGSDRNLDFDLGGGTQTGQAGIVIVKAGPKANVYEYEAQGGAVVSDTNLETPFRSISHITFCYEKLQLFSISGAKTEVEFDGVTVVTSDPRVADRTIYLFDGSAALLDQATTAADGSYSFEQIPPGTYTVCEALDIDTEFQASPLESSAPGECSALDIDGGGSDYAPGEGLGSRGHVVNVGPDSTGNDFANVIAAEGGVITRGDCQATSQADVTTSEGETIASEVTPLCAAGGTQVLLLNPFVEEGRSGVQLKFVIDETSPAIWSTTFPDEDAPTGADDPQISAIFYQESPSDEAVSLPWCEFDDGDPTPPEGFFACEIEQSGVLVDDGTIRVGDVAVVTGDPIKFR